MSLNDSTNPAGQAELKPTLYKRLPLRAVGYPIALLGILAIVLVTLILHLLSVTASVEHADAVIGKTDLLYRLLIDKETGLRGYALTGKTTFLEPYERAELRLDDAFDDLKQMEAASPDQSDRLDAAKASADHWQDYAQNVINTVKAGGDARSLILTEQGKTLMDGIRMELGRFLNVESARRDNLSHLARRATVLVLAVGSGVTLIVGVAVAFMLRRQVREATEVYRLALEHEQSQNLEKARLLASERTARSAAEHASRMKDEFLATLSHELRTPLNAIVGWATLLNRPDLKEDDLHHGVETIQRNARVQTQLIEDLLDMSRIISGKLRLDVQRVDPSSFILAAIETVKPAADAKGIRIERVLDPQAGPVSGDPNRLQQVIWNLLSNAIKFTPKGGKVQVLLERVNSHLEISVADTGEGINPEFLPFVFERFRQADASTTRKIGGLGLGLAIVKHLVELHGGTVAVKSPGAGQGATFIVHLPLKIVHIETDEGPRIHPRTRSSPQVDCDAINLAGLRVLVVDDEKDARELVKRVLEECRANVLTAGSATEGLSMIESEEIGVIISDIGMPEVDGYGFITAVRATEKGKNIPAIALTAFARSEDRTKAMMSGYLAHIAKPVEPSELLATVGAVTGRTGQAKN